MRLGISWRNVRIRISGDQWGLGGLNVSTRVEPKKLRARACGCLGDQWDQLCLQVSGGVKVKIPSLDKDYKKYFQLFKYKQKPTSA